MRVAVTVARDDLDRVAGLAARAGLDPVATPCIEVEPCVAPGAFADDEADWIVVTSARSVELVWPSEAPSIPFITVGPRTADAVRSRGGRVALEGAGTVDALIPEIDGLVHAGAQVLFPRASGAAPTTADHLRSRGVIVHDPMVYEVRSVAPPLDPVDAVAFASPSAVRGWIRSRPLTGHSVGAIGPTTAAAIAEAGGTVHAQPDRPSFSGLFHAIGDLR